MTEPTIYDRIEYRHMYDPLDWDDGPLQRIVPSDHPQPCLSSPPGAPLAAVCDPLGTVPAPGGAPDPARPADGHTGVPPGDLL